MHTCHFCGWPLAADSMGGPVALQTLAELMEWRCENPDCEGPACESCGRPLEIQFYGLWGDFCPHCEPFECEDLSTYDQPA
jgi:hypothetical protein